MTKSVWLIKKVKKFRLSHEESVTFERVVHRWAPFNIYHSMCMRYWEITFAYKSLIVVCL